MVYYNNNNNKECISAYSCFSNGLLCFFMAGKNFNPNTYFDTDKKAGEDGNHLLPMM